MAHGFGSFHQIGKMRRQWRFGAGGARHRILKLGRMRAGKRNNRHVGRNGAVVKGAPRWAPAAAAEPRDDSTSPAFAKPPARLTTPGGKRAAGEMAAAASQRLAS